MDDPEITASAVILGEARDVKQKPIGNRLREIYGSGTALEGLERLNRASSTLASALKFARAMATSDRQAGEKIAQWFLNAYAAGYLAGMSENEPPEGRETK